MSDRNDVELTFGDFEDIPWGRVLASVARDVDYGYANAFYDRAAKAQAEGELRQEAVFRLLGDLCSFRLRLDHPEEPFRAGVITEAFQSASPNSVDPARIEVLREVVPTVSDPWLRARMADFIWSSARGYPMAQLAVESYLELAGTLGGSDNDEMASIRALERALQLATRLGPKNELFARVGSFVEKVLNRIGATDDEMLSHRLLTLAGQYRISDPLMLNRLAAEIAERAEAEGNWSRAERYWLVAEDLALVARDGEKRRDALRRVAQTYVARAEEVADRPHIGKITAATHLHRAVEALRRAGGMHQQVKELQHLMMEYQREIPSSLIPTSFKVPIGDAVEEAQNAVKGRRLAEALLAFSVYPSLPNSADLRRQAEANARRYTFKALFPAVQLNAEGKVVARQGSTDVNNPETREAAIRVDMVQLANWHYQIVARASILPARQQIVDEHAFRVDDFYWIVSNNPLIQEGRELLFAEAFYAGFTGDMVKAVHILVHQLEHSVRELLRLHGVIVTGLSREGIQMERNLNTLLYEPKLSELLGEDVVFALQSLLVEKFGPDLRNRVAHGLMDYAAFMADACYYLWWLSFRLTCVPLINALRAQDEPRAHRQDESGQSCPTQPDN